MRGSSIQYLVRVWFVTAILALAVLVPWRADSASDFSYNTQVIYRVDEDGTTHVEEEYQITNNTSNKYLDGMQLSAPTDEVKNLRVTDRSGAAVDAEQHTKSMTQQGYTYNYQEISLKFNKRQVGKNLTWGFKIAYDTGKLVETKGAAHTVYIPAVAPGPGDDNYQVTLSVPQSFGEPHSSGAKPVSGGIDSGRASYNFDKKDLASHALALVFGNSTVYKANFNFPLKNDSSLAKTFTIALPPDTSSQKIFVNSLDPKPTNTRLDVDGNVLADYSVPAKTELTVKTDIEAVVKYLEYDLSASGLKKDIPDDLVKKYTAPTHYWQAQDPNLILALKAKTNLNDKQKVAEIVREINNFVIQTLSYNNDKIKYNIRQGSAAALKDPANAVCLEYSDLMIAMLRSQGIPARMPIGYGYTGNLKTSTAVSDSLHSWVEAYVPGVGWINIDPTWGEKFDNFGRSDLDHFAFAVWGANDSTPVAVTQDGNDQNYQYEKAEISYVKKSPQAREDGHLQAKKWAILPFVSVVDYQVTAPANVAGDNYLLRVDDHGDKQEIALGSLAPAQKLSAWLASVGVGFLEPASLEFVRSGDNALIMSSVKVDVNIIPMVIILMLMFVAAVVIGVKLHLNKKRPKPPLPKDSDGVADDSLARASVRKKDSSAPVSAPNQPRRVTQARSVKVIKLDNQVDSGAEDLAPPEQITRFRKLPPAQNDQND